MSTVILRRRNLGRTSCRGIVAKATSPMEICRTWRDEPHRQPEGDDLVIRWGCTASVESNNVLNTAAAIHQVNDKAGFRMLLQDEEDGDDPLVPTSWTYNDRDDGILSAIDIDGVVVRPLIHARGRNVYLCTDDEAFAEATAACNEQWYASEYIEKVAEYRVFVVQGRAVAVAEKTPSNPSDVAWNVARGGRFDVTPWDKWPLQAVRKSIEAFNLSELDFGGVDVMVDAEGKAYVIEINSAPSLTSEYRQGCMAKAFDYIVEHGKERIPLIEARGGYRKFIHPAICDRAQLVVETEVVSQVLSTELTDEERATNLLAQALHRFTDVQLISEMNRRELR